MDTDGIFNLSNDNWQMFDSRQRQKYFSWAVRPDRLSGSRSDTWRPLLEGKAARDAENTSI
jgi:hypothetical protein